ncbi:MAG: lysophospholipid acyltransferase family protein [Chloroherpetonaceae bacterium]|nr:lysophospholipid acyltransferase family protein [Chloroherpetonaceae bacterium]
MLAVRSALIWIVTTFMMTVLSLVAIIVSFWDGSGRSYLRLARVWARIWLGISNTEVKVFGTENIEKAKAYVVASNHSSYFDIPALLAYLPLEFRMVAKQSISYVPVLGWGMKRGDFIFIKRGANREALRSLDGSIKRLKEGKSVVLFADGTRSMYGNIQPFKRGAFMVAERAGADILPVTILGSHKIMQRNSSLISSGTITVVIGKPISNLGKSADELLKETYLAVSENFERYKNACFTAEDIALMNQNSCKE